MMRLGMCGLALLLVGCEKHEEISTYTVPSHQSIQTPEFLAASALRKPQPKRMLAAVVPHGPNVWLFRMQGPPDLVGKRLVEFRELMKSVRFRDVDKLEWNVPKDWQEKPGDGMWHATLVLPGNPALEIAVIKAPANPQINVLNIVNFCRRELQLQPISATELPLRTEQIEAGDMSLTMLDITGVSNPRPMRDERGEPDAAPEEIQYQKPAEWTQVRPKNALTSAAFQAKDGEKQVSITLSRAGGSKAANVNRWRGQLGLEPQSEQEVLGALKKIPLGSRTGTLVELNGDGQIMLGLMLDDGNQTVFVKLTGDPELAAREKTRLLEFAKSLQF